MRLPERVGQALHEAQQAGFLKSCSEETGQLLRTLAAMRPGGRIGEVGSGFGVSTAWLASGMDAGSLLFTVDSDAARAESVKRLFDRDARVTAISGDWTLLLKHAPFDLLFLDARAVKTQAGALERCVQSLTGGGALVVDDLTPGVPPSEDALRRELLEHPELVGTEVLVRPSEAVIVASRPYR